MLYNIVRAIVTPIVYLLFNIKFEGLENIKEKGGFVLCCNHRTLLDPVFIVVGIKKRKLRFMAKQELFKNRIFGAFLESLGAFPVNRGKGDMGAVKKAEKVIEKKHIILIFPEGTRSKTGKLLRGKTGAAHIACDTGADIVPAAICYKGKLSFRKKVTVCFGKPLENSELNFKEETKSEDCRRVTSLVMEKIADIIENHEKMEK